MLRLDNRTLIQNAADNRRRLIVRLMNGDVHRGYVTAMDEDGGFLSLSENPTILINSRLALTVEVL